MGIIVTDGSGSVLLGGRVGQSGWQFPQGGIQEGETPQQAMYRELSEEVGLGTDDVEVLGFTQEWLHYRLPGRYVRRNSKPLCVGQKQRWFLLKLNGSDDRLSLDTTDVPEFDRWRWVDYWRPVKEVIYFKRGVYVRALQELGPLAFPGGVPPRPRWWPQEWLDGADAN